MLEYVKFTGSAYNDKNAKERVSCRQPYLNFLTLLSMIMGQRNLIIVTECSVYHLLYYCPSFFLFHFLFLFLSHRSPYRFCFSCAKTFPIQLLEPILKKKSGLNFFSSKVVYRMCNSDRKKSRYLFIICSPFILFQCWRKTLGLTPTRNTITLKEGYSVLCWKIDCLDFSKITQIQYFPRTGNPSLIFHMFRKYALWYNPEHIIIIDS